MQKINTLLILILLVVVLYACGSAEESKSSDSNKSDSQTLDMDKLKAYQQFLNQLDASQVESIVKGAEYFTQKVKSTNTAMNDSAYAIFSDFHFKVGLKIDENTLTKNQDAFFEIISDNKDNQLKPVADKIKQNGLRFGISEGYIYVSPDYAFQRKHFFDSFSPTMQTYFAQDQKEYDEIYADDGGLIVTPTDLAKRVVYWEDFLQKNPNFFWNYKAKQTIKEYTAVLFNGMDNSPIFFYEGDLNLSFKEAYQYLKNEKPETVIGKKAIDYLALIEKNKGRDSEELKSYRAKNAPWE